MPGRKRSFPCGHHGRGQYCHRCAQEQATSAARQTAKESEAAQRAALGVNTRGIPFDVVQRAAQVLGALRAGLAPHTLDGVYLDHEASKRTARFELGRRWRLLCRRTPAGQFEPLEVLSHEAYNRKWRRSLA